MPPVRFDKFYKYDELTAILQAWASEHPDRLQAGLDRQIVRRPRHLAGDRHQLRHRPGYR